jgi:hypothetical protein
METRPFGRTDHYSSVAILGAFAFSNVSQAEADAAMEQAIAAGTMIIKAIAREPWGDRTKTYNTWYRPLTRPERIQQAVNFALSQDVTGICTAGDIHLLPLLLQACQDFTPLAEQEQEALIASASANETIFA